MEGDLRSTLDFEASVDGGGGGGDGDGGGDDAKVLAGLSTVLVATIQEVKDRISHIEFLFCSQLFPRIQSRSRALQRRLSAAEARRTAGEDWGERKASLLRQIEELRLGKQLAEEEARCLAASVERERSEAAARHEAEKALLLTKLDSAERAKETVIAELKEQLRVRVEELAQCRELQRKQLEQYARSETELEEEKRKRKQFGYSWAKLEERYKNLKSQYCFLLRKTGLTHDATDSADGESFSPASLPNKRKNLQDPERRDEGGTAAAAKRDGLEDEGGVRDTSSATSSGDPATVSLKPELLGGPKLTLPSWVDTRARQEARGVDPHDDFLDTPMENIRGNLRKMPGDEPHGIPNIAPKEEDLTGSDGETKEMNTVPAVQKPQVSVLRPEKKGFKYAETVRKKAERENLKGVECKQCKKFYDAVLPDARGKDGKTHNGDHCEIRCEHHEGVSRHRYRFIPPMTPEGFWNIGFDSEM